MKIFLNVPFKDKNIVKKLGAMWSPGNKKWYVENVDNLESFLLWIPAHLKNPHVRQH